MAALFDDYSNGDAKNKDALADCLQYKEFLDKLTPTEWFDEQRETKKARQEARRQARIERHKLAWEDEKRRIIAEARARLAILVAVWCFRAAASAPTARGLPNCASAAPSM